MVGTLISFWDGLFSGAMLVSGRVARPRNAKVMQHLKFVWSCPTGWFGEPWSRCRCLGSRDMFIIQVQQVVGNISSPNPSFVELGKTHFWWPSVNRTRLWFQILYIYFHPYVGKWSNLTNIFQMGWNHQPEDSFSCCCDNIGKLKHFIA